MHDHSHFFYENILPNDNNFPRALLHFQYVEKHARLIALFSPNPKYNFYNIIILIIKILHFYKKNDLQDD